MTSTCPRIGQSPSSYQHRLSAVDQERVDDRDQDDERQAHPQSGTDRRPGAGQLARQRRRRSSGAYDHRIRVEEGDGHESAEIGDRGTWGGGLQGAAARRVGEGRPHPGSASGVVSSAGSGVSVPPSVTTA